MRSRRRISLLNILLTTIALSPSTGRAEYKLQRGDTLSISIANMPTSEHKATIGVDGMVVFPLTIPILAAGRTLAEVASEAKAHISQQAVKIHGLDRDVTEVIAPDEVTIDIAEYRPIYVRGDVAKPGELVYRPGMTVRQAIALAGGYDIVRFRLDNPIMQASDLTAEYNDLWIDYARAQVHLAVVKGALEGKPATDFSPFPIPATVMREIIQSETQQADIDRRDYDLERKYLEASAQAADESASTISGQREKTQSGLAMQSSQFDAIKTLASRGFAPRTRVTEENSVALALSGQITDSIVKQTEMHHSREEFLRIAGRLEAQRKLTLTKDMEDTNIRIADLSDKIQATGEKLKFAGRLSADEDFSEAGRAKLTIYRATDTGESKSDAQENEEIVAGDTIDVHVDRQRFLGIKGDDKSASVAR